MPAVTESIRFLLGSTPKTLKHVSPSMTVLEYLRGFERMTGEKEGCAEGDCGACTVVIADCVGDRLRYRAVNSCIMFVPFLHGRQLITVENLRDSSGTLHPVQQALVNEHGSQCGFCTPGFVMSMFGMVHNHCATDRKSIDNALAGNLCRCTGYAPIVRASRKVLSSKFTDQFDDNEKETVRQLKRLKTSSSLHLEFAGQRYFAPTTVKECTKILARHPDSHIVSGATDVGLWVTKQRRHLETIVYVGNIKSLQQTEVDGASIRIGAAATINDAMEVLSESYPALDELFRRFGSVQIRNLATLGGNVANGSPIGDSLPAFVALDAKFVLTGATGSRIVPAEDFFIDYGKQDINPGEFLERIDVPLPVAGQQFKIYKLSKRYYQDISAVCGAFSVIRNSRIVESIRICYGGMAATPRRANKCENALAGRPLVAGRVQIAVDALADDFAPITDFRASAEYRSLAAGNLLRRMVQELASGDEVNVWSEQYARTHV